MTRAVARTRAEPATGPELSPVTLLVLLAATFLTAFDFFVVNVAAPSIARDLHASSGELQLVVGGYAFAYAGALILGGRLGDLLGHRRVFALGMLGFIATSAVCGLVGGPVQLVLARLGQGLTAAFMMPQVLAIISRHSTARGRARAMAWYGVAGGAGSLAAQVLGGLLITADVAHLGWRLIFLLNVPLGLAGALAAPRVLPADPGSRGPLRGRLDPLGALGLALGMALVLVPLTLGHTYGWPGWTWVSLGAAPPVLALTLAWQRAVAARGGTPLLQLRLLRLRSFRLGLVGCFAFMAYFASYMFTLAVLLQDGLGLSAFHAGLAFAPAGVAFSVSALLVPRLVGRARRPVLVAGGLLTLAGLIALAVLAARDGSNSSVAAIVVLAAVISLGNGVVLPSLIGSGLQDVPAPAAGLASGALTTAQQFAGAVGVAAIGTVFFAAAPSGIGVAMACATACGAALVLVVVWTLALG